MTTILGISGSLRSGSFNTHLLQACVQLMPEGAKLETASIRGVPIYDGDVESEQGIPAAVVELKQRLMAADGLLIVTPEYNGGIPGPFKNAIDWMSRPSSDIPRVFGGRPVATMGASPGKLGTALSQRVWLGTLRHLRMEPWFGSPVYVANAEKVFDAAGTLTDEDTKKHVAGFLRGYVTFVAKHARSA